MEKLAQAHLRELRCLDPKKYIDGSTAVWFLNWICRYSKNCAFAPHDHILNDSTKSLVYTSAHKQKTKDEFLKQKLITNMGTSYAYFIVNVCNNHWVLLIVQRDAVDENLFIIQIYDPLETDRFTEQEINKKIRNLQIKWRYTMQQEGILVPPAFGVEIIDGDRQNDLTSCGIFCILKCMSLSIIDDEKEDSWHANAKTQVARVKRARLRDLDKKHSPSVRQQLKYLYYSEMRTMPFCNSDVY